MRKLLLLIAALTLTIVPSALAGVGTVAMQSETLPYDLALPPITFGDLQFDGKGAVLAPVTVTNEDEVTIPKFDVAFTTPTVGWAVEPVSVSVPQLEPTGKAGAVFATVVKLLPPADVKPGASFAVAARAGNLEKTKTFALPALALTPSKFKGVSQRGFKGLRYEAIVTTPAQPKGLDSKTCATDVLKPSAKVLKQGAKAGRPQGKFKKLAAGDLAKGTLKFKGGTCRLAFEYFFDHKYDGDFGSFTFDFKPTIGGKKLKVSTITATVPQKLTPGAPIGAFVTVKKLG